MKDSIEILNKIPEIKKLTIRGRLLRNIVEVIIELQRFPSLHDLKLLSSKRTNFPDFKAFEILGNQQEIITAVRDFCKQFNLNELLRFCSSEKANNANGKVYLYRAGQYYKIGRTNDIDRRNIEIKLQLPFKPELIHTIETSNPNQIEKYWHELFKSKRRNGEWFSLSDTDVNLFKSQFFM